MYSRQDNENTVRRTGGFRKAATMPSNFSIHHSMEEAKRGLNDSCSIADGDDDFVDIRRRQRFSLPGDRRTVRNGFCPTDDNFQIYENDDVDDDDDDDSDFNDDTDDETIYENPMECVFEAQAMEKKREEVAKEFLHIEQTYLEKLAFLRMVKRQLESMNSVKTLFPPDEPNKMFPHIEELFQLHCSIKLSLEQTLRTWQHDSSIAKVFLPNLPRFNVYADFIKSFPLSVKTLEVWKEKEEKFSKLLTIFQQHSSVCVVGILEVMHEPYIRLQRLKLLFERYKKYLISTEKEFQNIQRIVSSVEMILRNCEGMIQTADDLETLLKLVERIEGVLTHLASDVRLEKEGSVTEVDPRGKNVGMKARNQLKMTLHLFLFNRFLLICSPVEPNKKQTIQSKVKMSAVKLLSCDFFPSMGYDSAHSFVLQTPSKARLIVCQSAKEAKDWKEAIEDAVRKSALRLSFKREGSVSAVDFSCAPVWIPDDYVNACMLCVEKFTLIRRRHHCRGCGIIVCSKCSPGKLRLPYDSFTTGRVCRKCYRRANKHQAELVCSSGHSSLDGNSSCGDDGSQKSSFTFIKPSQDDAGEGELEI